MPQGQSQSTNFEVGETVLHKVILVVAPDFVALATFTASNRALTVRAVYKQHGSCITDRAARLWSLQGPEGSIEVARQAPAGCRGRKRL
jgi:hypothetical protein